MKRFSYIILLFSLFLAGCDSDDDSGKTPLELGIQDISFEANGGNQEVTINLNGSWQAVSDRKWCTIEKNGQKVVLQASLNPTIAPRTAVITVSEGNGEGSFTVIQEGSQFNVFPDKLYLPASGHGIPIVIRGNIDWQAETDEIWCHSSRQGDSLMISADTYKNEQNARYAQVTIQVDGQIARTIPIIQIHHKNFNLEKWSDTNLGASLPATPENLSGKKYKKTWGNYYQWGRNIGFSSENPTSITVTPSNRNITAAQGQEMSEFITNIDDWLIDGSLTTRLSTEENPYIWTDRSGTDPCQDGYRLPFTYEYLRIFPSIDIIFKDKIRNEGREILDATGTEYNFVSINNGASTAYIIKMYGTTEAYVLRYEFKGISGYNGWIRITEIKGNTDTDLRTPEEAAALFVNTTEMAERCFPICGVLWGETAEVAGTGSGYWSCNPSVKYPNAANACTVNNTVVSYADSYRRSLGCLIRGIKK